MLRVQSRPLYLFLWGRRRIGCRKYWGRKREQEWGDGGVLLAHKKEEGKNLKCPTAHLTPFRPKGDLKKQDGSLFSDHPFSSYIFPFPSKKALSIYASSRTLLPFLKSILPALPFPRNFLFHSVASNPKGRYEGRGKAL